MIDSLLRGASEELNNNKQHLNELIRDTVKAIPLVKQLKSAGQRESGIESTINTLEEQLYDDTTYISEL